MAVEALCRRLRPLSDAGFRAGGGSEVTVEQQEESSSTETDSSWSHGVGYLCCLSLWVAVALNVRWRWELEEAWCVACLHTTKSFLRCLPNLLSLTPGAVTPCWSLAFLSLLLLLLTASTGLHRRPRARAQRTVNNNGCWLDLVSAHSAPSTPVNPGMPASGPAQSVDPGKTESSCAAHTAYLWSSVQMSTRHHGDFVLSSPGGLSAERGGQEHGRTKRGAPLQGGFPCLEGHVLTGFVGVLSIFVLPLNLSVNILLIRTIESLLETCLKSLFLSAPSTITASSSHNATLV